MHCRLKAIRIQLLALPAEEKASSNAPLSHRASLPPRHFRNQLPSCHWSANNQQAHLARGRWIASTVAVIENGNHGQSSAMVAPKATAIADFSRYSTVCDSIRCDEATSVPLLP